MVGALFRPFFDPRRLLFGAILSYVPILALLATGYAARMARAAHDGAGAPSWRGWPSLFVDGVAIAVVTAIYAAPYAIVASSAPESGQTAPLVVEQIILVLTMLAAPAALARGGASGNWFSAFNLPRILRRMFSVRYLAAWTVWAAMLVAVIIGVASLPSWGAWLVPAIVFLQLVVSASLFGWAVRER
jgi:hypothetical protein